jgi:hypothetical protein
LLKCYIQEYLLAYNLKGRLKVPPIRHNYSGKVNPELVEADHKRYKLSEYMFEVASDVAARKRKERGVIKSIIFGSLGIRSPEAIYDEEGLAPGLKVKAWLAAERPMTEVRLYTQIAGEGADFTLGEPLLRVTALGLGRVICSGDADRRLEPESQLQLFNDCLDTVELISLEMRTGKPSPTGIPYSL